MRGVTVGEAACVGRVWRPVGYGAAGAPDIYEIRTRAAGPAGSLPFTEERQLHRPSGDLFGLSQNAGMGWNPAEAGRQQ